MEQEQQNGAIDEDEFSEEIDFSAIERSQHLDDLASLVVEKILDDERLKVLTNKILEEPKKRDREPRTREDMNRCSDERENDRVFKLKDLITEKNKKPQLTLKIDFLKQYFKNIEMIYSEMVTEYGLEFYRNDENIGNGVDCFLRRFGKNESDVVELLLRIEKFVLILAYAPTPALLYTPTEKSARNKNVIACSGKYLTALGCELLYFFDHYDDISVMKDSADLSSNIKLFSNYLVDYKYKLNLRGKYNDLLEQDIGFEVLNELNYILSELRDFILDGKYVIQPMWEKGMFKKPKEIHYSSWDADDFKKMIQNYSTKLESAIIFFRRYKQQNISLHRLRIKLVNEDSNLPLSVLRKFFSEWNRYASKPEAGFEGYLTFFYLLSIEPNSKQYYQDIVLVMDSDTLLRSQKKSDKFAVRNIRLELFEYINKLMARRAPAIFGSAEFPNLEVSQVPLMQHLDLDSQLLIEASDKENWGILEQKILPYFIYQEFLDPSDDMDIRERFSRGQVKPKGLKNLDKSESPKKVVASS